VKLHALLAELDLRVDAALAGVEITDVVSDSRRVTNGALFVAIDGARSRGVDHIPAALERGAVFVVATERLADTVPHVVVADCRRAIGVLASAFHGHPSRQLKVLAITGTNGKTTVANLVAQLLRAHGCKTAAIGTLGVVTEDGVQAGKLTTPECADLHRTLAQLAADGVTHVALEASSHALDQRRLAGLRVAAAVWTNLSHDHLDYHGDMAAYAAAKSLLFTELLAKGAPGFVYGDDLSARSIAELPCVSAWSHGANTDADHQLAGVESSAAGTSLVLHSVGHAPLRLAAPILGNFNADNLVAAALLCRSQGMSNEVIATAARNVVAPAGRLEALATDIGSMVIVDYAHTPDALERTLEQARNLAFAGGRVLCVFGCGGDRDKSKRAVMGEIAGRGANLCIVTSDNPRGEDPDTIIAAICDGLSHAGAFELDRLAPSRIAAVGSNPAFLREPDRAMAIRRAVGNLQLGDVLIIAGKGHESTQTIAGQELPFDDALVAKGWLARHRRNGSGTRFGSRDEQPVSFSFDGAAALRACGGSLLVNGRQSRSLCTDSRAIVDDCVFVALSGERFDGNKFIAEAIDGGAAGVVCAAGRGAEHLATAKAAGAWILEHDDTLVALGNLANGHRQRFERPLIGITGSNGKTTTKELTALALGAAGSVVATHANHNNRIGVPLTLARLRAGQRFAVVEMGTSEPGEIPELARIARPLVGVLTNVAEAHLLRLGTVADVAIEKMELLRALPANGVAIAPADEPLLQAHLAAVECELLTFGRSADASVQLVSPIVVTGHAQRFDVRVIDQIVTVAMPGIGVHLADNAMAALAVAHALGVNIAAAARALANYRPVGQRMLPSTIGNRLILEDCYNANPRSSEVALTTLVGLAGPTVAVMGDMLELGPAAAELHARVGRFAAESGVDALIGLGAHATDYVTGATAAGMHQAVVATDVDEAVRHVVRFAPTAGTVLVKGSRGARMERVIAALKALRRPLKKLEVTNVSLAL
jgi:MurE/MurF fusion protein